LLVFLSVLSLMFLVENRTNANRKGWFLCVFFVTSNQYIRITSHLNHNTSESQQIRITTRSKYNTSAKTHFRPIC
jgi:hypothetical protein